MKGKSSVKKSNTRVKDSKSVKPDYKGDMKGNNSSAKSPIGKRPK